MYEFISVANNLFKSVEVDRDNNPSWKPATIYELLDSNLDAEIEKRFKPTKIQDALLGDHHLETPELEIIGWNEISHDSKVLDHMFPEKLTTA